MTAPARPKPLPWGGYLEQSDGALHASIRTTELDGEFLNLAITETVLTQ